MSAGPPPESGQTDPAGSGLVANLAAFVAYVSLKLARTIGLAVPPAVLAQATEVMQ